MRDRVAAIIIRDKRILLVTGYDEEFYWTPGGKVDEMENHEICLKREINSELNVDINIIRHYATYELINEVENKVQKNHYYLVEIKSDPRPGEEVTKIIWYSRQDFLGENIRISKGLRTDLIPNLIEDNII